MEDSRTKAALDALADLFLTGTAPASAGRAAGPLGDGAASRSGESQLDGPRPIRLSPKLRAAQQQAIEHELVAQSAASAATNPSPVSEFTRPPSLEEGTSSSRVGPMLRLHRPDAAPAAVVTGDDAPPRRAAEPLELQVEAVYLGNLPGFGGPWLTQYAHHLAQRRGPVGILHIDDEQIEVDLVTSGRPPLPQDIADPAATAEHSLEAWAEKAPHAILPALVEALIHRAPVSVATWIVHLPTNLSETTRSIAHSLKRWTLLCGADEVAVAAGSRLFKTLLENDSARDQRRLGTMIVGADEARSFQAADRLRAAASTAGLGTIELVGWQKQMVPVSLTTLASFADPAGAWEKLWPSWQKEAGIDESLPSAPPLAGAAVEAPNAETAEEPARIFEGVDALPMQEGEADDAEPPVPLGRNDEPAQAEETAGVDAEPLDSKDAQGASGQEQGVEPPRQEPAWRSRVRPTPATVAAPHEGIAPHGAPAALREPDLATFIPGVLALPARSPKHPTTQLALDEDGVLHLLRRHATQPKVNPGEAIRAAVLDLIETRAWVREHLELLALTQRQMRFDPQAEPVLHLFTDDAKLATALASRLGAFVRLHLLKQVHVGESATWFSTELN